jgi:NTE family protein
MTEFGYSSKLNAEWPFLVMLKEEGRRSAENFLSSRGDGLVHRSTIDLDALLQHA